MAITNPITPKSHSFTRNFIPVKFQSNNYLIAGTNKIKPNYAIGIKLLVDVFAQDGVSYQTQEIANLNLPVLPGSSGVVETDLHELLNSFLEDQKPDFPGFGSINIQIANKSTLRYRYKFGEISDDFPDGDYSNTSGDFYALYGGLSYLGNFTTNMAQLLTPQLADKSQDRFLRQGNTVQYTRTNQPQFLYFYNFRAQITASLKVKLTYTDNTTLLKTVTTGTLYANQKHVFNLTFDSIFSIAEKEKQVLKYEIWLEDAGNNRVSELRTFYLNYEYREYVRYFLFWSCWGSFDTRLTYGKGTSELEIQQQEAKRIRKAGYRPQDGDAINFDIKINSGFKVATGWLSKKEIALNRDFFTSPFKYRYTRGVLLPISIVSKNIPETTDGQGLLAQNFEYKYLFDDDCYTEGDEEENGDSFDGFFFHSSPITNPTVGFQETDPTVPSWVKGISQNDIARWNIGGNIDVSNYYTRFEVDLLLDGRVPLATTDFIRNQTSLQPGAEFHVQGGKFTDYLVIPTGPPSVPVDGWVIYVDEDGDGGSATPPPSVAYFKDLLDVSWISPQNGQIPRYNSATGKLENWTPNFDVDLSSYAKRDGSNAYGTWDINITGEAARATRWGGYPANFAESNASPAGFTTYNVDNERFEYSGITSTKNALGIDNGYTLNNSISGSANRLVGYNSSYSIYFDWDGISRIKAKVDNTDFGTSIPMDISGNSYTTTYWGGLTALFDGSRITNPNAIVGYDSVEGRIKLTDKTGLVNILGLGSAAYKDEDYFGRGLVENVQNNTNANDLNAYGFYINTTGNGTGNSNFPISYGTLQNVRNSNSFSGFQVHSSPWSEFHIRQLWGGTWGTWKRLLTQDDINPGGETLESVVNRYRVADRIVLQKITTNAYDSPLEIGGLDGSDAAISFHKPGEYIARLTMNGSGRLIWYGNGIEAVNHIGIYGTYKYINHAEGFVNDNWYRSIGNTGWYNSTHDVGIYSREPGWVDCYNNASFRTMAELRGATIRATNSMLIPEKSGGVPTGDHWEIYVEV